MQHPGCQGRITHPTGNPFARSLSSTESSQSLTPRLRLGRQWPGGNLWSARVLDQRLLTSHLRRYAIIFRLKPVEALSLFGGPAEASCTSPFVCSLSPFLASLTSSTGCLLPSAARVVWPQGGCLGSREESTNPQDATLEKAPPPS